jgi:nuclear pore complex protein Nup160
MQIFERYNISEGACQFAYAALEQVDDAYNFIEMTEEFDPTKAATYTRGRLWANVFKFTLDLNLLNDAYCAIISNPDEEIKRICLRRFIIVLFECGKTKVEVKNPFLLLSKFFLLCFWRRGTKILKSLLLYIVWWQNISQIIITHKFHKPYYSSAISLCVRCLFV